MNELLAAKQLEWNRDVLSNIAIRGNIVSTEFNSGKPLYFLGYQGSFSNENTPHFWAANIFSGARFDSYFLRMLHVLMTFPQPEGIFHQKV